MCLIFGMRAWRGKILEDGYSIGVQVDHPLAGIVLVVCFQTVGIVMQVEHVLLGRKRFRRFQIVVNAEEQTAAVGQTVAGEQSILVERFELVAALLELLLHSHSIELEPALEHKKAFSSRLPEARSWKTVDVGLLVPFWKRFVSKTSKGIKLKMSLPVLVVEHIAAVLRSQHHPSHHWSWWVRPEQTK